MIEISFARASTDMRMVDPMMITATPAKARPSAAPASVAIVRMRWSFATHSSPYRTSSVKS